MRTITLRHARTAAAAAALAGLVAGVLPAASDPANTVVLTSAMSYEPARMSGVSGSTSGVAYVTDRTGVRKQSIKPAGATEQHLPYDVQEPGTVVGALLIIPVVYPPSYEVNVLQLKVLPGGAITQVTMDDLSVYVANTGSGFITQDLVDSTLRLRRRNTAGAVVQELGFPTGGLSEAFTARADGAGVVYSDYESVFYRSFTAAGWTGRLNTAAESSVTDLDLAGNDVAYLSQETDGSSVLARVPRAGGTAIKRNLQDTHSLAITDGWTAWVGYAADFQSLVLRSAPRSGGSVVSYPTAPNDFDIASLGESPTARVLASFGSSVSTAGIYSVAPGATSGASLVVLAGQRPARVGYGPLDVVGNRVGYADDRTSVQQGWARSISRSSASPTATLTPFGETLLTMRSTGYGFALSSNQVAFLDQPTPGPTTSDVVVKEGTTTRKRLFGAAINNSALQFSGTRLLYNYPTGPDSQAVRMHNLATGGSATMSNLNAYALWGSYLVTLSTDGAITRKDYVTGAVSTLRPAGSLAPDFFAMGAHLATWGDWVFWSFAGETKYCQCPPGGVARVVSMGDIYDDLGAADLGDGVLAYLKHDGTVRVRDLRVGGGTTTIAGNSLQVATDDEFIAWVGFDGRPRVTTTPFTIVSAPRYLGGVVPSSFSSSWAPRFELTKTVTWSLTIRSGDTVVRTLSGGAALGAVRPVWDGKNASGVVVAPGSYTWSLSANATDGDGALRRYNGSAGPVTGAVTKS